MAFLVVSGGKVQLLPVEGCTPYDRLAELIPRLVTEVKDMLQYPKGNQMQTMNTTQE